MIYFSPSRQMQMERMQMERMQMVRRQMLGVETMMMGRHAGPLHFL